MSNNSYISVYAKSFNWAGFFLPKKIYEESSKLYAFCRVLDDIVAEKNNLDSKIEKIDQIKKFFKKSYDLENTKTFSSN